MVPFIEYEYEDLSDKKRQYDDIDYLRMKGVDARYIKYDTDKGNPYIEALPKPRSGAELDIACRRDIPMYDKERDKNKENYELIMAILKLREIRFPLPFNYELENAVFSALVLSYRARNILRDDRGDVQIEYKLNSKDERTDGLLVGDDASATNAGITMIGYSGCGKSSSLEVLFKNYPQVIIHHGKGMTTYPQIVYLVVQCPPHSNFRGLYKNIGIAIDRALGNISPVYEKELDAGERGNLAIYNDRVRKCIEKFAIGIIIFDEIQHINFNTAVENSFEAILELSNQTKVAFGIIGTEDSYGKIFSGNLRQARRLGAEIHADKYCNNKQLFTYIVKKLFKYQWFNEPIVPTDDMVDVLYKYSHGIIDQLIGIYMYMNIDYVLASRKPEVNAKYIKATAERHYPGIMELLKDISNPANEAMRAMLAKEANRQIIEIANAEKAKAAEKLAMKAFADPTADRIVYLKQFVVQRVLEMEDAYTAATIENVVDKVLSTPAGRECIDNEIAVLKLVSKKLKALGKTDKRKQAGSKKTKITPDTMKSYLEDDSDM